MHAVGGIQADALAVGSGCVVDHLIDVCGTKILAWAAEFFDATVVADVRIVNNQMSGLIDERTTSTFMDRLKDMLKSALNRATESPHGTDLSPYAGVGGF